MHAVNGVFQVDESVLRVLTREGIRPKKKSQQGRSSLLKVQPTDNLGPIGSSQLRGRSDACFLITSAHLVLWLDGTGSCMRGLTWDLSNLKISGRTGTIFFIILKAQFLSFPFTLNILIVCSSVPPFQKRVLTLFGEKKMPDLFPGKSSGGKHLKFLLEIHPGDIKIIPKVLARRCQVVHLKGRHHPLQE